MTAAQRAQTIYNVLAREPDLTVEQIIDRVPDMRRSHVFDAMAKLHRDSVVERSAGPPVGEAGERRYRAKTTDHPNYQAP